jgi:hypothetical protein
MTPEETRFLQLCMQRKSIRLSIYYALSQSEGVCSLLPSFQDMFADF